MMIASNFKLNLNLKPRANAGNLTLARRGPPGPGRAGPGLVGSPPPYPHTTSTSSTRPGLLVHSINVIMTHSRIT